MRFLSVKRITYCILGAVFIIIITLSHPKFFANFLHDSISELMGSRNTTEVVKPEQVTILSEPLSMNQDGNRDFGLILVTSTPEACEQREGIRRTWGKLAKGLNLRVVFTMGIHYIENESLLQNLVMEQSLYDDLVIDNFDEGYYLLTGKMLRMLKWFCTRFWDASILPLYLIKTDHDVFLNLPQLVRTLKGTPYYRNVMSLRKSRVGNTIPNLDLDPTNPETYFVGGKRFNDSQVDPDPTSKWHLTSADRKRLNWGKVYYPPYANGACYVLSGNAVKAIYEASFSVPLFPFEDLYLTGLVAHDYLNLSISNMQGMWDNKGKWDWDQDQLASTMQIMHPVQSSQAMLEICQKLESCKNPASTALLVETDVSEELEV